MMQLKISPQIFLDELTIELGDRREQNLTAQLEDDKGIVCRTLTMEVPGTQPYYKWYGLNELPYGVYTCEISQGAEKIRTRIVKR